MRISDELLEYLGELFIMGKKETKNSSATFIQFIEYYMAEYDTAV